MERRIAPLPAARPGVLLPASRLDLFRECPRAFYYSVVAGLPEPPAPEPLRTPAAWPPGRVVGDVLHRCLELLGPGRSPEECLARAAAEKAPAGWQETAAAEARLLLARFAASDIGRELAAQPGRKEWSFIFHLPDPDEKAVYTFTGRADCLVAYPDGSLGVIDYKTDRVAAGEAAQKAGAYTLQLALYVMAAEAAGLGRVRDARLHFLRPGVTVTAAADKAATAAAAAEILALGRHVRRHDAEEGYPGNPARCRLCGYKVLCRATGANDN